VNHIAFVIPKYGFKETNNEVEKEEKERKFNTEAQGQNSTLSLRKHNIKIFRSTCFRSLFEDPRRHHVGKKKIKNNNEEEGRSGSGPGGVWMSCHCV